MFSALKKLTGRQNSEGGNSNGATLAPPPGLTTMSSSLQKKFAKGVHYNMKIILKGDRNVGKTQLFRRIQGQPFLEEYTATEEIQVANITWSYKTSDDIVKVEIWDVVDVANKKKRLPTGKLKLENSRGEENGTEPPPEFALDANTIDVYKNTNGVILVFDITKPWTYEYVKREVENVPEHIPILIMGNRRDMGHHRTTAHDTVTYFIEGLERPESAAEIRYTESSMRNGFGLKFIHKFFNLPYLHLQKEALLKQLDINRHETEVTVQELEYYADSDDANYDLFIDGLSQKRRQVADALSPPKLTLAEAQAIASSKAMKETDAKDSAAVAATAARLQIKSDPTNPNPHPFNEKSRGGRQPPSSTQNQKSQSQNSSNGASSAASELQSFSKSLSSHNNGGPGGPVQGGKVGVEDFVPEVDVQISSFLDDGGGGSSQSDQRNNGLHLSSDEDEEAYTNPMVAGVIEDVEESDLKPPLLPSPFLLQSATPLSNSASELDIPSEGNEDDPGLRGFMKKSATFGGKVGFDVFVSSTGGGDGEGNVSGVDLLEEKEKKHHKKKKSKHHSHGKKKKGQTDLEDFLSGGAPSGDGLDTSAYEAL